MVKYLLSVKIQWPRPKDSIETIKNTSIHQRKNQITIVPNVTKSLQFERNVDSLFNINQYQILGEKIQPSKSKDSVPPKKCTYKYYLKLNAKKEHFRSTVKT